ncbi:MAG: restriction endonuclease subunit S [Microgenomates group bacterium]
MNTWSKQKIEDIVERTPKTHLEMNREYPFLAMENISSSSKSARKYVIKKYTGTGSRYLPGDTLYARITPCLQNKKITQANYIGFGSTELFVFRCKENISDPNYIYYLLLLDDINKTAEISMTGASGRQRADIKSILEYETLIPELPTQIQLGSLLSKYDNLIRNNERRIKILEEMSQLLYIQWFVGFKFPGYKQVKMGNGKAQYKMIPEGWEVVEIGSLLKNVKRKIKIQVSEYKQMGHFPVVDQGRSFIAGYTENKDSVYTEDLIVFGDHSRCFKYCNFHFACGADGTQLLKTSDLDRMPESLLYFTVLNSGLQDYSYARHFKFLKAISVLKPTTYLAKYFDKLVNQTLTQIKRLKEQNICLIKLRDILIPQIITGKRQLKNQSYDKKN